MNRGRLPERVPLSLSCRAEIAWYGRRRGREVLRAPGPTRETPFRLLLLPEGLDGELHRAVAPALFIITLQRITVALKRQADPLIVFQGCGARESVSDELVLKTVDTAAVGASSERWQVRSMLRVMRPHHPGLLIGSRVRKRAVRPEMLRRRARSRSRALTPEAAQGNLAISVIALLGSLRLGPYAVLVGSPAGTKDDRAAIIERSRSVWRLSLR